MQSESIFTATSGNHCEYEVSIEDGHANANVVWQWKPSDIDCAEVAIFLEAQADEANFPRTATEQIMLGQIRKEDVPRAAEIIRERMRERK